MPHPTDGRRLQITITQDGRDFLASNMAESERIMAGFQQHLGNEKLETLLDLLNQLDGVKF